MAFYYKKQEEAKKMEAESEDAYLNSAWANPKVPAPIVIVRAYVRRSAADAVCRRSKRRSRALVL